MQLKELLEQKKIRQIITSAEKKLSTEFQKLDEICLHNQAKVLDAFHQCKIGQHHFAATNGYGYGDIGRDTLCRLYAEVFRAEEALVSPHILSGTHALTLALFGVLRPNDIMLSVVGTPYDTMQEVIHGQGNGSLRDFHIGYEQIDLTGCGTLDYLQIERRLQKKERPKLIYVQRSSGYDWRDAITVNEILKLSTLVKKYAPESIVFVDNCYGEFVQLLEPIEVGADLIAGSLIKNIGGGIAPNGGYIVGKKKLVDLVANRMTAPSIGAEVGSSQGGYQYYYQGLFLAPHTTMQALKGAKLISCVLQELGYQTKPNYMQENSDIICAVQFPTEQALVNFCKNMQAASPIDSYVTPVAWEMPGYQDKVIMAAGCFVQGASIELSCDAPIKPPYTLYMQGGLTYEHVKLCLLRSLSTCL